MASAYLIIVWVRDPTEHWMNARNSMLQSALGTPPNIEGSKGTLPRILKFGIIFGIFGIIWEISEKNVFLPVLEKLTQTIETKIVDYSTFVNFKKSTNILIFLWERANRKHYDRFCLEFTTQLIESQFKAITSMDPDLLRNRIFHTQCE